MPDWHEIFDEINQTQSKHDHVRRKYLSHLRQVTGRNTIVYYSGWLQKPMVGNHASSYLFGINDNDKNGFMTVIHGMDPALGLDLILHTPGGETAATESLVDYLRSIFGTNIRAIVPQLAMSAGTMVSCACKEIVMGKQSSLGPIDPQIGGMAAHGVIEEFLTAHREIQADPTKAAVWQPIIARYTPTFIGECQKAMDWANQMAEDWLRTGMLDGDPDANGKIQTILQELGDHSYSKSHARHLSIDKCRDMGLNIYALEEDDDLQDAVLSVHHAVIHTLGSTGTYKIIENDGGKAFVQVFQSA